MKPTSLKFKCIEEGFTVNVNPESLKIVGQASQQVIQLDFLKYVCSDWHLLFFFKKLKDYLQKKNADLKTLIQDNLFKEIKARKIR